MSDLTVRGPAYEWALWSTSMRVAVGDPHALPTAKRLVDAELASVERAVSPTLHDSELSRLVHREGQPTRVSAIFMDILDAALEAASTTDGDVDPTLGDPLAPLHLPSGRPLALAAPAGVRVTTSPALSPGWQRIALDRVASSVTVPADVRLDLSLMSRAWAADRCAALVGERLGIPVLVALGGDVAAGGPAPAQDWTVLADDSDEARDAVRQPSALVTLPPGAALSTASVRSEQWARDAWELRQLLQPGRVRCGTASARPLRTEWRTATVVAGSCVQAATWSSAALLRGSDVLPALSATGLSARFVDDAGRCRYAGSWPEEAEVAA